MNTETTQKIHDDATQDFENLSLLLIAAKTLYDEQPEEWQGLDAKISSVVSDIRDLLGGVCLDFDYLKLVGNAHHLLGFIDGCRRCNKLDELYVTKIDMSNFGSFDDVFDGGDEYPVNIQSIYFGSLRAFDAGESAEYFSVFLPLLQKFMDENSDIFPAIERKRGASIRLVGDDGVSA